MIRLFPEMLEWGCQVIEVFHIETKPTRGGGGGKKFSSKFVRQVDGVTGKN